MYYSNVILNVCETCVFTLWDEHRSRVFEEKILKENKDLRGMNSRSNRRLADNT